MAFREGEQAYIIENNSHVTPVYIIKKDRDFYTIEFSNYARINLRESRLYHTLEEAKGKIRRTPFVRRQVKSKKGSDVSGSYKRERRGSACKMPNL